MNCSRYFVMLPQWWLYRDTAFHAVNNPSPPRHTCVIIYYPFFRRLTVIVRSSIVTVSVYGLFLCYIVRNLFFSQPKLVSYGRMTLLNTYLLQLFVNAIS